VWGFFVKRALPPVLFFLTIACLIVFMFIFKQPDKQVLLPASPQTQTAATAYVPAKKKVHQCSMTGTKQSGNA
jgi:hypothetical protein